MGRSGSAWLGGRFAETCGLFQDSLIRRPRDSRKQSRERQ